MRSIAPSLLLALLIALSGCDAVLGSKDDPTTDEIFEEGQIDPTLVDEIGYVPLNPFFQTGANGLPFQNPADVYVGFDELIYVVDEAGLHVLDLAGRAVRFLDEVAGQPLRDATAVVQDRRFDLLVAARRDTTVTGADCPSGGTACDLAVVYRLTGATTGDPVVTDILWHVFDDDSRQLVNPVPRRFDDGSDEDAVFTDVTVLADNDLYVTRAGPVNRNADLGSGFPFNALLFFTNEGENTGRAPLNAITPSLRSTVYPTAIQSYLGPPQRTSFEDNPDFFIAQAPPPQAGGPARFGVLAVEILQTPNGTEYRADPDYLTLEDPDAPGLLYEEAQFVAPSDLAYAPDDTRYLFVLDGGADSLFVFNPNGIEGVAPPPGASSTAPVNVSFGGTGGGALQFSNPQGIAYYERTLYVADTGNNRIGRYRLNTDFE